MLSLNGESVDRNRLADMVAQLRYRGPDGFGFYQAGPVGLAHARLSIIDIEGGAQPIHNEDRSVWVVFNGEIFNYLELRRELEERGHRFYTRSDTEVIVHLYEERGKNFLSKLNGQFAIALWDDRRQSLLLARDRVGIAPLFYSHKNGAVLFGSEIKAILAAYDDPPALNPAALDQLFTFWSTVSPATFFEGIFEVPPGEWLEVKGGHLKTGRWWDFDFPVDNDFDRRGERTLADELRERLEQACQLRLRADVPVGAYLSGGLDSSVIAALVHKIRPEALRTFSIAFASAAYDESEHQRAMAAHLGTAHETLSCSHGNVVDELSETVWHTESPVLRTAPVPMRLLSRFVREREYKVVLTGEGADEVLGGYDLFKEAKVRQFWAGEPQSVRRPILLCKLYPYLDLSRQGMAYMREFYGGSLETPESPWFSHLPRWKTTAQAKVFFSNELREALKRFPSAFNSFSARLPESFRKWHWFNRAQYIEAKLLMGGYLLGSQGDRMLMANGVEGRFPFLDHNVIEFASALPPKLKMKAMREKYLLRLAMANDLPTDIVWRHKQPYRAPDGEVLVQGIEKVTQFIGWESVRDCGYFDGSRLRLLVEKVARGNQLSHRDSMALTGVVTTQVLHHHFIAGFHRNFRARRGENLLIERKRENSHDD